ncbi:MAG: RNA methyltransferase [Flavobacteriaceae bacterium]|nr:RNA methyltransferase [Flavobacteriaceae bacterium]
MTKHISSIQNPLIKDLILYKEKSRARRRAQLFLIEGRREISLAVKGDYDFRYVLFNPDIHSEEQSRALVPNAEEFISVSEEVYHRLAYREGTQGILGVAEFKAFELADLQLDNPNPLILVAEAPEKPGNIGGLLRTADAAALDAVIIANPKTDMFNPNIVRSSVGCLFTNQIGLGSTSEVIAFLRDRGIKICCASLQASEQYDKIDLTGPTALVVGTESEGLSEIWTKQSDKNLIIPMLGEIDSMNVSVAAGILIFEAKRQRGFK